MMLQLLHSSVDMAHSRWPGSAWQSGQRVIFLSHRTRKSFPSSHDLHHLPMSEQLFQVFYQSVASLWPKAWLLDGALQGQPPLHH